MFEIARSLFFNLRRRRVLAVFLTALSVSHAHADSPKITAVLTSSETALGQPVQLEIRVSGTSNLSPPDTIKADGLDIRYTGQSQNFEMFNLRTNSSVTINYTVMPTKTGTFKIPSQALRVGNETLKTPELTLRVVGGGNRAAGGAANGPLQVGPDEKLAFAELVVPKKTAYVGEIIPVVIRVAFNSRGRVAQREPPHIAGQGFTTQKLSDEEHNLETINGRSYVVYSYKTAVSAARAGSFQLGPVETNALVLVPRRAARPRHMPFDPFDDDILNDPFAFDPFSAFGERREITVKSDPVPLEVKPLPSGAPPGFSGAVGAFTMAVQANPKRVQIGDPITINASITGRGNFDRVNAPTLSDSRGWHSYPPSAKFKQDDDIGLSGEKTFEMVVSPTQKEANIPPLLFAYFDPSKEKYVTLQTEAVPVTVEENAQRTPASSTAGAQTLTSPVPAPTPVDILHQIDERGPIVRSFAPIYARREFWVAQLVPLLAALAALAWMRHRAGRANREAVRVARLHREADDLLRSLRRDDLGPREYFSNASRFVQLKTALKENVEPGAVDADLASRAFNLDADRSERLRGLFATSDELRYSGSSNGAVSPERRRQALELVESFS